MDKENRFQIGVAEILIVLVVLLFAFLSYFGIKDVQEISDSWEIVNTRYFIATEISESTRREPISIEGDTWIYGDVPYYIVSYHVDGSDEVITEELSFKTDAELRIESGAFVQEDLYENKITGKTKSTRTRSVWSPIVT